MKKLLFIFLLATMFSCEKNEPFDCYLCNVDSTVYKSTNSYVRQVCNVSEDSIKALEFRIVILDSTKMWYWCNVRYNCQKME